MIRTIPASFLLVCLAVTLAIALPAKAQDANKTVPQWIWHSEGGVSPIRLRSNFEVSKAVKSAIVSATCDNGYKLFLNGRKVLEGSAWERPDVADVTKQIKLGKNVFAVDGTNQGAIAGFILRLKVTFASGKQSTFVSDGTWKVTKSAGPEKNWQTGEFDDSSWASVNVIGPLGEESLPWSRVVSVKAFNQTRPGSGASGVGAGAFVVQPAENTTTLEGFKLEKIVHVPREMGSWVALAAMDDGTLIASDQRGAGLYRITPGTAQRETQVKKLPVDLSGAQGLLWAFDSLYAVVNGGDKSGLHRITDKDGDGELDHVEFLMPIKGGGEHGPHAVIFSPDKQSIFVCCGNHTKLPSKLSGSRIPRNWNEDHLLPRRWDANGHAAGILAPGGWICKVDPAGKDWEVFSMGYRNQYDIAFNADGELFSYDADMEWDLGSPWYRPTRVVHATSGSEFGWRSGTGKWPTYYEDSLPPAVDIGPGSPVGIAFGYGAKFPAKYQQALFILDWTYSTIYAVHLSPDGSTYSGDKEDFVTGEPLQVTDVVIGSDGAMYFTAGGRGTQSSMYRVTYIGDESTAAVKATNSVGAENRQVRRALEAFHGEDQADNLAPLDQIIDQLENEDRFIRYAARIALEARPIDAWRNRVLGLDHPQSIITGSVAIARQGSERDREPALEMLARLSSYDLSEDQTLGTLRALQLIFARLGEPTDGERRAVLSALSPHYPTPSARINAELVQLLVYLDDPDVVNRTLALMSQLGPEPIPDWGYLVERHKGYGGTVGKLLETMPPARAIHFAHVLRTQKSGWTLENRRQYFEFFQQAAKFPGGNSYTKFLSQFRDDALLNCSAAEKVALDDIASVSLTAKPPKVTPPQGPGHKWTRDEVVAASTGLKKRDFKRGRNLFHATQCAKCHRLGGEGGAIGPDLSTAARKYPLPDLADALIDPSKAISDQYGSEQILTVDGETFVGRVVRLDGKLHVYGIDANLPPQVIAEADVEVAKPSKISQMPTGLLDVLSDEELKDLMAYLLSGGNQRDKLYRK